MCAKLKYSAKWVNFAIQNNTLRPYKSSSEYTLIRGSVGQYIPSPKTVRDSAFVIPLTPRAKIYDQQTSVTVTAAYLWTTVSMPVVDGRRESCSSKTNANLKSKQLLMFVCERRSVCQYWVAEEIPADQRKTSVTVHLKKAVTAVCFWTTASMPLLDGRRKSCSSKTNSSNCLLEK